ncbi:MAG: hypothetical protein DRH34_07155 [Deltaproteobacteria bacterium]|nr:MAG: hypothetical protein DRH34_07155 [Deltaproteobacteria bacterium]RLC19521.1 MAG: hypothetical protein DRH93_15480 [Deltaproteobacteria bacterium]
MKHYQVQCKHLYFYFDDSEYGFMNIRPEDVVLVAQENGILGFIAVWYQDEPYIDNLHIKSSARSKKLGSVLMKSAAGRLIQQGQTTAYLWAAHDNERAIHFYERLGGVCTDRALQDYLGTMVPNVKIVWPDLSILNDIRL